jgi:hypothetical protein
LVAIPADRLKSLLKPQEGDDNGATGAATPPETPAGPMASPMSTPEPKMGSKEGALVNLSMALDLIQQAIPSLGAESDEGKKAMLVAKGLNGILGPGKPRTDELQPAEIMQLLGSLPKAGNVTPEVAAVMGPGASKPPTPVAPMIPPGAPPGGAAAGGPPTPPPQPTAPGSPTLQ